MKRIFIFGALLTIILFFASCTPTSPAANTETTTVATEAQTPSTVGEHAHQFTTPKNCLEKQTCTICGLERNPGPHSFVGTGCVEPRVCEFCGTEGSVYGHKFEGGDCVTPPVCSKCGEKGELLNHKYVGGDCLTPSTCSVCGAEGPMGAHSFTDPTCLEPSVCVVCGIENRPALGHTLKVTSCTEPPKCIRCDYTEGEAPGHTTSNGICSRCGLEVHDPITGHGDDVISNIDVGEGLYKAHITYSGEHVFTVWIYNKDDYKDLAVNELGDYDGYVYLYGSAPYTFEIESHGSWSITIERIGTTDANSFTGKGDYVTDIFSGSTGTWHISHDGDHVFSIWLYTTDGRDLIVNALGEYDGRRRLTIPTGSKAFLVIEADGKWSIEPAD